MILNRWKKRNPGIKVTHPSPANHHHALLDDRPAAPLVEENLHNAVRDSVLVIRQRTRQFTRLPAVPLAENRHDAVPGSVPLVVENLHDVVVVRASSGVLSPSRPMNRCHQRRRIPHDVVRGACGLIRWTRRKRLLQYVPLVVNPHDAVRPFVLD